MKILLVAAAGLSSRFSQSLGETCLKCIYHSGSAEETLLYQMLHLDAGFDKYIIVGGFMYEQLKTFLKQKCPDIYDRIILVKNEKYVEYGSGYSLYKGLQEIVKWEFDEVVFAEGDLYVDKATFLDIIGSPKDIITCNQEAISAEKAVAFYFDKEYRIHYVYDTLHSMLNIGEPFRSIYNSGQVWKFRHPDLLRNIYANMEEYELQGTNLLFIQKYFQSLKPDEYDIVQFRKWINCNTIVDYEKIRTELSI